MATLEKKKPTLADVRAQARASGIEIAAEREAAVLAASQHLHDAARHLERFTADGENLLEPARR